jgi:CRP/FNR family cyclic AMP-dependent transcriptional regulator
VAAVRGSLSPDEVGRLLGSTQMFSSLDPESLAHLAEACTQRVFPKNQYLWYQGDVGDRLAIVASGLVKVVLSSEQGDEMVLATLGPYDTVGELAVLDGAPRAASVIAAKRTTVLMLTKTTFLDSLRRHPAVLDGVLRSLGAMIRRQTERTGDLVFLDLGGRIAKLLLHFAEQRSSAHDAMSLDLGLSQSDLAAMVGGSRPAVNRVLHAFSVRGMIHVDRNVIVVRDIAALRRRAKM